MKKGKVLSYMMVVMLVFGLTSCTSFETRDGLYRVAEEEAPEITIDAIDIEEDVIDIMDEDVALGGFDMPSVGFDLGRFTGLASVFVDQLSADIEGNLLDKDAYETYDLLAIVPKDDLMSVVTIELEHLIQFDDNTWTDRRSDYSSGNGYTISTFTEADGVYYYDLSYNDDSGAFKEITVVYNSLLKRYDYVSESYNKNKELSYKVWQQFCESDEGGYYYQALRHSVIDDMERTSFSYFDNISYETYITPTQQGVKLTGLIYDLYKGVPESLEMMVTGYEAAGYFSKSMDGEFLYELSESMEE